MGGNPLIYSDPQGLAAMAVPVFTRTAATTAVRLGFPNAARNAANAVGGGVAGCILFGYCSEADSEGDSCPVDKDNPPKHPDFTPDKKRTNKEKIPWNKNRKGFKDKKGNYWEPVPDGHKGTHDPHWDVQKPDGSHTPVYPPKN